MKHGKWILAGHSAGRKIWQCSNCKSLLPSRHPYCGECGAKMDSDIDEVQLKELEEKVRNYLGESELFDVMIKGMSNDSKEEFLEQLVNNYRI